MDDARFDDMVRGFDARLTRRHAGGLATGALIALGLGTDVDAKKKKKKRKKKGKKKKNKGASDTCSVLNEGCGSSPSCGCFLDTSNNRVCLAPPSGSSKNCQSNADCPAGSSCEKTFGVCLPDCAT